MFDSSISRQFFCPEVSKPLYRCPESSGCKTFQHRLEDDKIAPLGEYVILFTVSSFELPTTFFIKGGFFVYSK